MSQTLGSLPIGAKIKEKDTKYLGVPIVWVKADTDHTDYPSGSTTLITEKSLHGVLLTQRSRITPTATERITATIGIPYRILTNGSIRTRRQECGIRRVIVQTKHRVARLMCHLTLILRKRDF